MQRCGVLALAHRRCAAVLRLNAHHLRRRRSRFRFARARFRGREAVFRRGRARLPAVRKTVSSRRRSVSAPRKCLRFAPEGVSRGAQACFTSSANVLWSSERLFRRGRGCCRRRESVFRSRVSLLRHAATPLHAAHAPASPERNIVAGKRKTFTSPLTGVASGFIHMATESRVGQPETQAAVGGMGFPDGMKSSYRCGS